MSEEEKTILGVMTGFDLILSPEHYEKYKGNINKQLVEKDKKIERLTKRLEEAQLAYLAVEEKNKKLHSIIKEVRELVEKGTDFKCITFRKVDEDTWKLILASHIKENFLEILDKENI